MNAHITSAECFRDADGCSVKHGYAQHSTSTFAATNLASWMLHRTPEMRGLWRVCIAIRGLSVMALAVHDDFGNLQFVE